MPEARFLLLPQRQAQRYGRACNEALREHRGRSYELLQDEQTHPGAGISPWRPWCSQISLNQERRSASRPEAVRSP